MFTIKVQVIRNTAHRLSTQASYTIGSGTTMQENQQAAQIAAKHTLGECDSVAYSGFHKWASPVAYLGFHKGRSIFSGQQCFPRGTTHLFLFFPIT